MTDNLRFLQLFSVRQVRIKENLTSAIVCRVCGKHVIRGKKELRTLEDAYLSAMSHECKKV